MIGCPRCGSHVVIMELQYTGTTSRVMEKCIRKACGHWWFDNKTPRRWTTIAMLKGQKVCFVE